MRVSSRSTRIASGSPTHSSGSAVSARETHTARRALHARLAEVAPTQEERARHLAIATVRPDREVATIIEEAVHAARARGARSPPQSSPITPSG